MVFILSETGAHAATAGPAPSSSTLVAGCSGGGDKGFQTEDGRLEVIAAAYPFAWLAEQVGGPARARHQPGRGRRRAARRRARPPARWSRCTQAALVVYLKGFQPAVDDAVGRRQGGPRPRRSRSSRPAATDPHIWLDPARMETAAVRHRPAAGGAGREARQGLPAAGRRRRRRAPRAFTRRSSQQLRGLRPARDRHEPRRVRLPRRALRPDPARRSAGSTPDAEPSPGKVAEVTDFAREHGVTTIFFESLVDPKVAQDGRRARSARRPPCSTRSRASRTATTT